jgi:hypothetical protein
MRLGCDCRFAYLLGADIGWQCVRASSLWAESSIASNNLGGDVTNGAVGLCFRAGRDSVRFGSCHSAALVRWTRNRAAVS